MTLQRSQVSVADTHDVLLVDGLTRTQIVQYAGASGDYNPLHTDEVFAVETAGYPSVFAHGMLSMAMTGRALTDWVGDDRLTRFGVRFIQQVWPGDTLSTRITVEALHEADGEQTVELAVSTSNQDGVEVLTGHATARLDP